MMCNVLCGPELRWCMYVGSNDVQSCVWAWMMVAHVMMCNVVSGLERWWCMCVGSNEVQSCVWARMICLLSDSCVHTSLSGSCDVARKIARCERSRTKGLV